MDIKAYIESGIIEAYVMGLATEEEQQELHELMLAYPEIRSAVDDYSARLENHYLKNSIKPGASVKEALFKTISDEENSVSVAPANIAPVVKMETRRPGIFNMVAIAASALLIISIGLNIYFYNQFSKTDERYQALLQQQNEMQSSMLMMQARLAGMDEAFGLVLTPGIRTITMGGVKDSTETATVFWDENNKTVYLNTAGLPAAPQGFQYQLWALVDGKPVDAGMVTNCSPVCKMNSIQRADAFAITLEKAGGSPVPTLTELHVLGKI